MFEAVECFGVFGEAVDEVVGASYEGVADEDVVSYFFGEEEAAVEHGSAAFVEYLVDGFVDHRWWFPLFNFYFSRFLLKV